MQTMYLALGIFLLTYVLMLTLQKYRPTIALSSALLFIVLGLCGVFDFRPLDALAAVDYNVLLMIAGLNACALCWNARITTCSTTRTSPWARCA